MKKIYFQCDMGTAGDMICGSLLDLFDSDEQRNILDLLNNIGFDGVSVRVERTIKCSVSGLKFNVEIRTEEQYHKHTHIGQIYDMIDSFNIDDKTKCDAKNVYAMIAKAESKVHNADVADIHLHEVGAKDAIMDIVSACYLFNKIGAEQISASPITTGCGSVKTAHGIMSVPAPASAELLLDIPCKTGNIEDELATPTGIALLRYFANDFTYNNEMTVQKTGCGMGSKNFERANCIRAFYGDDNGNEEVVYELRCEVDDMTGEEMGYCINKLIQCGANDAFVQSVVMKKSRPGMLLTVVCGEDMVSEMTQLIFKHTTTLGVRKIKCKRNILNREITEQNCVRVKKSTGFGTRKEKVEFDDLAKLADKNNISVFDARKII